MYMFTLFYLTTVIFFGFVYIFILVPFVFQIGIAVSADSPEREPSLEGAFENDFGLREIRPVFENLISKD